jgi:hypothetical protein
MRLVESGIYEHEVRKSLLPKGFGREINTKIDTNVYENKALTFSQMRGIFLSILVCLCVSIVVLFLELLTVTYLYFNLKLILKRFLLNVCRNPTQI